MLSELRGKTADLHHQVEKELYGKEIRDKSLSLEQYKLLLKVNLVFHTALEKAIEPYINSIAELEYEKRKKSHLIKKDLKALDEEVPSFRAVLKAKGVYNALGMLYVAEGSTLGGQVILKAAQQIPDIDNTKAHSFYNAYNSETGKMWKKFIEYIYNTSLSEKQREEVINSATEAFQLFSNIHGRLKHMSESV